MRYGLPPFVRIKPRPGGLLYAQAAQSSLGEAAASHAYDAAQVAAATRPKLIELGRPFIAETVFSHRSKLDLSRADNTRLYGPRIVAQMSVGDIIGSPSWSAWTPEPLQSRWLNRLRPPGSDERAEAATN